MSQAALWALLCGVLAAVGAAALALLVYLLRTPSPHYRVEIHVQTGVEVETGRLVSPGNGLFGTEEGGQDTVYVQQGGGWYIQLQDTAGRVYAKTFAGRLELGRTQARREPEQCLYIGAERSISRRQCILYEQGGTVYLANCSAANPTKLDGRALQTAEPVRPGSLIQIGGCQLRLLQLQKIKRKG